MDRGKIYLFQYVSVVLSEENRYIRFFEMRIKLLKRSTVFFLVLALICAMHISLKDPGWL